MMQYKGYMAKVEYDDTVKTFLGRVLGIKDVVTFEGTTVKELEKEFHASVDVYLEFCKSRGVKPEKPYSGEFRLRLDPNLHRELALAAELAGDSLNSFLAKRLRDSIGEA
ncbi:MAG TPA: type II toxin-antitoxin system HicB family antitoxin [Candidatus Hydrogenedentes bacterium]|nr:type II toxin-antitoxin system HicB family antitoxin [Candidatus Hydrogenedentota bacterium]